MIKLKDCVIVDVVDDEEVFSNFAGTWSEDIQTTMHNLTFITEQGDSIQLESYSGDYYGEPSGFSNIGELYVTILREVYSGEMGERTFTDFIRWIVSSYAQGLVIIHINNKKGLITPEYDGDGYQSYYGRLAVSWYMDELTNYVDKEAFRNLVEGDIERLKQQARETYGEGRGVFLLADDLHTSPISITLEGILGGLNN